MEALGNLRAAIAWTTWAYRCIVRNPRRDLQGRRTS